MRLSIPFAILLFFSLNCNPPAPPIEDTSWQLVSFYDGKISQAAVTGMEATLLMQKNQLMGTTGCNRYNGNYELKEGRLLSKGVAMTKKYCQETAKQEQVLAAVLQNQPTLSIENGQLSLKTADNQELVFAVATPKADGANVSEEVSEEKYVQQEEKSRAIQTANARSLPEIVDENPPIRGMFAYLADAAIFINCADGKRYPVAMEGAMPDLQKAYRELMGDDAGRQALVTIAAKMSKKATGEDDKTNAAVIVNEVISLTRAAKCDTDFAYFQGEYRLVDEAAVFKSCSGEEFKVAADAAASLLKDAYLKANAEANQAIFATFEGFVKMDGSGEDQQLHVLRFLSLDNGFNCP